MHHFELIGSRDLQTYLLTETALFIGLLQFRPVTPKLNEPTGAPSRMPLAPIYRISLILFVGLNLAVYCFRGIPLLAESRLEIYRVGGGWGLVTRLFDLLLVVIVYHLLDINRLRKWKPTEWLAIGAVLIIQVLSGAKSSIQVIVFIVTLHAYFNSLFSVPNSQTKKALNKLALAAIVGFLLITQIQNKEPGQGGQRVSPIVLATTRLINNGDAFIYAYQDNIQAKLDASRPVHAFLREFLAFFRIESPERLPTHLGNQIAKIVFGPDAIVLCNAKHNLFGYVYFGLFGGILFSYFVGTCIGFVRYRLMEIAPRTWVWGIAYIILNLGFIISQNDWDSGSRAVISTLFLYFPFVLAVSGLLERLRATLGAYRQP